MPELPSSASATPQLLNRTTRRLIQTVVATALSLVLATGAPLGTAPAAAQSIDQIADELVDSGRFVELSATSEIDEAIEQANEEGVAFAWLDTDREAEDIANDLAFELDDRGSRYKSVLVLTNVGVWAESFNVDVRPAADASFEAFSRGAVAEGLETFSETLAGRTADEAGAGSTEGSSESSDGASSDGASSGLAGWIWIVVLALFGFVGFRFFSGRRKTRQAEAELLELDRVEVKEQLRDNADRVIDLGDKAIASSDAELIRTYEEASRTYTEVSSEVDGVTTIEAMNRLDGRMDHAQWQFEVIEAKLEGRTPPTAPAPETTDSRPGPTTPANHPTGEQPPPPNTDSDRPALGPDDSVFGGRRPSRPRYRAQRRRSGGIGGGLGGGGGLGAILGGMILGGGMGRPRTSRRTQQRRASTGSWTGGGSGLGGGVLRGGSSGRRGARSGRGSGNTGRGGGGSFNAGRRSRERSRGGGGSF